MSLKIAAYAKLNLSLFITGVRDDGYHTLNTVMQSVALADIITLELTNDRSHCVQCSIKELSGQENLAYKAACLFTDALNLKQRFNIYIEKHIPVAGGMGGGSADAAAVLFGLNHWFDSPFSTSQLCSLALQLGADVPFCLVGGTQIATGIGEILEPLPSLPECGILLLKPCEKGSTGAMYRKYDEIKGLSQQENCDIINWILKKDVESVAKSLENTFQSLYEDPSIQQSVAKIMEAGALGACLTGSGPTVFGIFKTVELAQIAKERLLTQYDHCVVTTPVNCGCEVICERN